MKAPLRSPLKKVRVLLARTFNSSPVHDSLPSSVMMCYSQESGPALLVCVLGSAKRRSPGLVNFVNALAYHSCLALSAAFTQPGVHLLEITCNRISTLPSTADATRLIINLCIVCLMPGH